MGHVCEFGPRLPPTLEPCQLTLAVSLLPNLWAVNVHIHYCHLLGPFHGAIVVPSVTRCRCCCWCCGHWCTGGVQQWRRATLATPGEWQCKTGSVWRLTVANGPNIFFSSASCCSFSQVGRLGWHQSDGVQPIPKAVVIVIAEFVHCGICLILNLLISISVASLIYVRILMLWMRYGMLRNCSCVRVDGLCRVKSTSCWRSLLLKSTGVEPETNTGQHFRYY